MILAHPGVDVNLKNKSGWTAFMVTCNGGKTSCARLLLKDSRVKVNKPNNDGETPLWFAVFNGGLDIIKWWIASGREMDLGTPEELYKDDEIWVAMTKGMALLERFKENPEETRYTTRVELGYLDELAAEVFALVVFVSDGLLRIRDQNTSVPTVRFFAIATQLPLELQMVLCHRLLGLGKEIIPGKDSEAAFKSLAKRLW